MHDFSSQVLLAVGFPTGWMATRKPIAPRIADRLLISELPERASVR